MCHDQKSIQKVQIYLLNKTWSSRPAFLDASIFMDNELINYLNDWRNPLLFSIWDYCLEHMTKINWLQIVIFLNLLLPCMTNIVIFSCFQGLQTCVVALLSWYVYSSFCICLFPHPYLVAKGQLSLWGGGKLDFDIILSKHGHRCITWGLSISIQCVAELCMSMNTNLCITLHKTFALCHYNNGTNVVKVYSHCYSGPWNLSCFWLLYSF